MLARETVKQNQSISGAGRVAIFVVPPTLPTGQPTSTVIRRAASRRNAEDERSGEFPTRGRTIFEAGAGPQSDMWEGFLTPPRCLR